MHIGTAWIQNDLFILQPGTMPLPFFVNMFKPFSFFCHRHALTYIKLFYFKIVVELVLECISKEDI